MSAGTITLTNGSAIVGGSGTSFATELAGGDFIVSTVGGVPYTLPVKTVDSNTQLTLVSNFTGPTQSGSAWSAVPRVALNMVHCRTGGTKCRSAAWTELRTNRTGSRFTAVRGISRLNCRMAVLTPGPPGVE